MNKRSARKLRAALALVLGASIPAFVIAQPAPAAPKKDDDNAVKLDKFVVTGSYIPSTETALNAGVSPVVSLDRKAIDQSGFTNTADLLQKVTISNANAVPISNNATGFTPGASSVSLRGLGPEATLVLINGRRVAAYPVGAGGTTAFVDLNSIPLAAVETIEVLKDGASALYGADAVAGVVNIKLRRGYDGTEAAVTYGNTTNKDAGEVTASLITGASTDKANVIVGLNYYKKNSIANRDREYSAVPPFLSSNSSPLNLELSRSAVLAAGVSASSIPSGLSFFGQSGATSSNNGSVPAGSYVYSAGRSSAFNFNEFSISYPSTKRMGAFASGERKIFGTDNIKAYIDLSYQNVQSENQLAPSATGNFTTSGQVELIIPARTTNPILTYNLGGVQTAVSIGDAIPTGATPGPGTRIVNGTAQRLAAAGAYNPFNPFNQDIAGGSRARFAEFGNRIYRNETDAFMFVTGIKGENLFDKWSFDASFGYSSIRDTSRNTLNSASRFNIILNQAASIFDPASSDYIGTRTAYNPFGYYRNPIASNGLVTDYDKITVKDVNESSLGQFNFVAATGELFELPAGPVGLAFGGDFRQEELNQYPDPYGTTGDLIGSSPNAITRGQRKIGGVFLEARLPILTNLEGNVSARHEQFLTSDRTTTVPKVGLKWTPLPQITVRASYSKGFREPSLYELYSSPTSGLAPITDPRNGAFESEQPFTVAGNRKLQPEKTDYLNLGFVWTPTAGPLKGFSGGVDYWAITRKNTVDSNPQDTVDRFFGKKPGGLLPGESVLLTPSGLLDVVNSKFFNVGRTEASGFDLSAGYNWRTDTMGIFELSTVWTYLEKFKRANTAADPLVDLVGQDSSNGVGEDGYLEWKGRVNFDWTYKGINLFVSGLYNDGFEDLDLDGNPFMVDSRFLVDAQVSYNFRDKFGPWLADTKIAVGARNVFDRDPPYAAGFGGNSTGYPSFLYSSEGRFVYVSLSRKF